MNFPDVGGEIGVSGVNISTLSYSLLSSRFCPVLSGEHFCLFTFNLIQIYKRGDTRRQEDRPELGQVGTLSMERVPLIMKMKFFTNYGKHKKLLTGKCCI